MRITIELTDCGVTMPDGRTAWLCKGKFAGGNNLEAIVLAVLVDPKDPAAVEELQRRMPKVTHSHGTVPAGVGKPTDSYTAHLGDYHP